MESTVHPHCGMGTYVFIEDGEMIPITIMVTLRSSWKAWGWFMRRQ